MELKILSKEEKPLLSRTEIIANILFDSATPKKEEVKKKIATVLKSDPNVIVIKKVATIFGQKNAKVLAFIYTNEKDMKRIEPKPKVKKGAKKEAPKEETQKEEKESKEEKKETPKEQPKEKQKEPPKEESKEKKTPKKE